MDKLEFVGCIHRFSVDTHRETTLVLKVPESHVAKVVGMMAQTQKVLKFTVTEEPA